MAGLVRFTSRLAVLLAVAGVATQSHPLAGLLHHALRWPLMALCLVLGGFALKRRLNGPVFLCLLCMSVLFGDWFRAFLPRATADEREHRAPITLLTYNLKAEASSPDMVLEVIHGHPADVMFFQEAGPAWRARLEKEAVVRPLHHECRGRGDAGLCIHSRWNIRSATLLTEPGGADIALCAVLATAPSEMAVCNVRFSPPFWNGSAGDFAEHFTLNARRRQAQWEQVEAHLLKEGQGRHRLVAGDFSMLEWEILYARIRHGWVDAYRQARWTVGATWPAGMKQPPIPLLRWDYVWLGPTLDVADAEVLLLTGSDHRALRVTLLP